MSPRSTSKVPFLGDIPILGWLFKFKTTRVEKTNLMIFITPYIIKNEQDAAEITKRRTMLIEEFRKEYRIEKKSDRTVSDPEIVGPAPVSCRRTVPDPAAQVHAERTDRDRTGC